MSRRTVRLSQSTRRDFLKRGALAAGVAAMASPLARSPFVLAADAPATRPNSKLGVAVIGCTNMGNYSTQQAVKENLVAIADIDDKLVAKAMNETVTDQATPKIFADYRKMLDECHKDIDVVLIATPDHHHAPAAIRAMQFGKSVFVQKPLAHDIRECRVLAEAAAKYKVHSQMGNQGHVQGEGYRLLCEYLWSGALGNIVETHTILGRNFGGTGGRPPTKPVPDGLHWDEWIGGAPYRDYHDGLHTFNWRNWRDFGTGTLGDMACHLLDGVFWALRVGEAKNYTVQCVSQTPGADEKFSTNNVLRWDVPARGEMPAFKAFAYDSNSVKPQVLKDLEQKYQRRDLGTTVYITDKGLVLYTPGYGSNLNTLPGERLADLPVPERKLRRPPGRPAGPATQSAAGGGGGGAPAGGPASRPAGNVQIRRGGGAGGGGYGPIEDLFAAVKGGPTEMTNFNYAGPFTEFILTGQLAMFAGPERKVEWDVPAMKCTNEPALNQFVQREYRKGWEV